MNEDLTTTLYTALNNFIQELEKFQKQGKPLPSMNHVYIEAVEALIEYEDRNGIA